MKTWYLRQKPPVRLLITFLLNVFMWFVLEWLISLVWNDDILSSFAARVSKSIFMGVWWTIFFSWPLMKSVFRKSKKSSDEQNTTPAS